MSAALQHHHIVPLRTYLMVGIGLLVLTAVTIGAAHIQLGGWNVVVALLIAGVKATMVALIFMHLLYDKKIFLIIFIGAILFLAVMIIFTMFDVVERGDLNPVEAGTIQPNAVIYKSPSDSLPGVVTDSAGL